MRPMHLGSQQIAPASVRSVESWSLCTLVGAGRTNYYYYYYKLRPPQEKVFIWPPFFQYNKRLLRQKTGGACLYMPQDGHWLASFEVIPPQKKLVFPRPKNENSPLKTVFLIQFFLKILAFYCLCGENFVTPFSTLAMIQGSLPTNSTTPDRLRSWTKTESEDFPGFWVRTLSKKSFFKRSKVSSWSTPQKKPIAGFSWPGGQ